MFIPVAHESDKVRRIPWISIAIIGLCFVVHFFISRDMKNIEKGLNTGFLNLMKYYLMHPYLHLDPEVKKVLTIDESKLREALIVYKRFYPPPEDEDLLAAEQEKLDQMVKFLVAAARKIPYRKWGFIPTDKTLRGLLSHMFIHGGWIHLIGNLLLLYLTGPFIEDVWGRPVYISFYLLMGMISAMMFAVHHPLFPGPLIGASGAISGLMGAFLVRYWKVRIKFIFIIFPLIGKSFRAPAWVMLPLWFILEIYSARIMDTINQGAGGVAHWAHIWGFIFGVICALGMKYFQVEEKHINPKIELLTTFVDESYQTYEQANQLIEQGNKEDAYSMLLEGAKKNPSNTDIVATLWKLSLENGKTAEATKFFLIMIENEIKQNRIDSAMYFYRQLKDNVPTASVSNHAKMRLVEYLLYQEEITEAKELTGEILSEIGLDSAPGLLLEFFQIASQVSFQDAERVVALAVKHTGIPVEKKDELKKKLDQIPKGETKIHSGASIEHSEIGIIGSTGAEEAIQTQQKEFNNTKIIKVTKAVPLGIKDNKLYLNIDKIGQKILLLESVKIISVIKISPESGQSFLLIDLLLDDLEFDQSKIRIIRLHSSGFDPRKFAPKAQNQIEAFRILTMALQKLSQAKPFPSPESLLLKRVAVFPSIQEYENFLQTKRTAAERE